MMEMDGKTVEGDDDKKGDEVDLDLEANTSAFEALERDFQEVLQELMGDQSLEKFRVEYEKLHRALKKSHEQEKRLVKKCRELNSEILNNQAKIKTALRLSQEDQKTIGHLQKEMEKTLKKVFETQERETRAKETIGQLKEEMVNLSKLVEKGAGLSMNQENMVKELKQTNEELQRQLDETKGQVELVNGQLVEQHELQEELRAERNAANDKAREIMDRLSGKENELLREKKRRTKTADELQMSKVKLDQWEKFEEESRSVIKEKEEKITEVQTQLADAKSTMEKYLKDYDSLFTRTQRITDDLDAQITKNKAQGAQLTLVEKELKFKQVLIIREQPKTMTLGEAQSETSHVTTWCCIDQGTSTMSSIFNKNVFTPQEVATGTIRIDNSQCQLNVTNVRFFVEQRLWLRADGHSTTHTRKLVELVIPSPQAGQGDWEITMTLDLSQIKYEVQEFKKKKG